MCWDSPGMNRSSFSFQWACCEWWASGVLRWFVPQPTSHYESIERNYIFVAFLDAIAGFSANILWFAKRQAFQLAILALKKSFVRNHSLLRHLHCFSSKCTLPQWMVTGPHRILSAISIGINFACTDQPSEDTWRIGTTWQFRGLSGRDLRVSGVGTTVLRLILEEACSYSEKKKEIRKQLVLINTPPSLPGKT